MEQPHDRPGVPPSPSRCRQRGARRAPGRAQEDEVLRDQASKVEARTGSGCAELPQVQVEHVFGDIEMSGGDECMSGAKPSGRVAWAERAGAALCATLCSRGAWTAEGG